MQQGNSSNMNRELLGNLTNLQLPSVNMAKCIPLPKGKGNKLFGNTKIIDLEEGEESLLSSLEFLSTSIDPPTKKRPSPDTPENIKRQYGRWKWNLKLDKKKGIIITENQKGSKRIKRSKKKKKEKPCRGKSKNRDKKHSFEASNTKGDPPLPPN